MGPKNTPRGTRFSDRTLVVLAIILWAAAAGLAAFFFFPANDVTSTGGHAGTAATATPGTFGLSAAIAAEFASIAPAATYADTPDPASVTTSSVTASSVTTSSTTTSTTTTTTEAPPPALTVAAGGDVLGDRLVGSFIDKEGGEAVFAEVRPLLETAHVAFINLESPLSETGTPDPDKEYTFLGRPGLIDGLVTGGIDVVSLANNHAVDYGHAALLDTIDRLDKAGVNHAGAGADARAARAPALLITPAGVVAVLAFTEIIHPGFPATTDRPGINPATSDRKQLLAAISSAKEQADFVIVSFHWGTEYKAQANGGQRALAHQAIDAGADLILGHHPHVIQGLEIYRDRLIAYSLGDFVWDHHSRETGEAFVLQVAMRRGEPPTVEAVPVYLDDTTGVPAPVSGNEADAILSRLTRLSADLGLELSRFGDRAVYATTTTPSSVAEPGV